MTLTRIKQVVAAQRRKARIDHASLALVDLVYGSFYIVVNTPARHTPPEQKGADEKPRAL